MKKLLTMIMVVLLAALVVAETPPNIVDFQQYYGQVLNLPQESYRLEASIGGRTFSTSVRADGKYGYSPTFKVYGTNGAPTTFSIVNAQGIKTVLGTAAHQNRDVTQLNQQYPGPGVGAAPPTAQADDTALPQPSPSAPSTGRSRDRRTTTPSLSTTSCNQNWDCGLWAECANGQQQRTCFRSDACDQELAAGRVLNVVPTLKPIEQRSCVGELVVEEPLAGSLCSSFAKRCRGMNVEQCSTDGAAWNVLDTCAYGCDASMTRCKEKQAEKTATQEPDSTLWYLIAGGVLIIIAIILLVILFRRKQEGQY